MRIRALRGASALHLRHVPTLMAPPKGATCKTCGRRYAQDRTRLCRTCLKAAGQFYGVLELERQRLEDRRARENRRKVPAEELVPRPDVERLVGGQAYVVVWDGT